MVILWSMRTRRIRWSAGLGVAAVIAAGAGLTGCNAEDITEKDFHPIALAEVRALTTGKEASKTLLLDSRLPSKYEAGHIPGARNAQLADAKARTGEAINPELDRFKNLVVYGEDPASPSAKALTMRLMVLQHKGVRIFEGGYGEWLRAGLPTEKAEKPAGDKPADTKQ